MLESKGMGARKRMHRAGTGKAQSWEREGTELEREGMGLERECTELGQGRHRHI
jgi:hypothetical protein